MKKIFIVTGGTGGHIFPAIALAEKVSTKNRVYLLGDKKTKSYAKDNKKFKCCRIISSQINSGKIAKLLALIKISLGVTQSFFKILLHRPTTIISFGGYATFPTLVAAVILRRRIILHEQNAHLGKVNRIFAKYCDKIATTFEETQAIEKKYLAKTVHTGTAIRKNILDLFKQDYQLPQDKKPDPRKNMGYPGLILASEFDAIAASTAKKEMLNILIIGGSGGAEVFSKVMPKALFNLNEEFKNSIQIYQQAREDLLQDTFQTYENFNMNIEIDSFFHNMKSLIANAHLVISRSGSTSIHEFLVAKKPMILVPFPKAADHHQMKNAKIFEKNEAAVLVKEKDFTIKNVTAIIDELLSKEKKLIRMSQNCEKYAKSNLTGTEKIIDLINER